MVTRRGHSDPVRTLMCRIFVRELVQISEPACLNDEAPLDWENLSQQVFSLDFDLFVDQTRQEGGRCPAVGEQEGTS